MNASASRFDDGTAGAVVEEPRGGKARRAAAPERLPDIASEQAHRMLSMEARHNHKLVRNARLLRAAPDSEHRPISAKKLAIGLPPHAWHKIT